MFEAVVAAVALALGNPLLVAVALGMLPISEVRGAAIYAFSVGQPWLIVPAAAANMLVCPAILLFWRVLDIPRWGRLILGGRLEGKLLSMGKRYETWGLLGVAVFIGMPLPLTGVYSGTLVAELLGINRWHTLAAAVAGVVMAAAVMFVVLGGLALMLG